MLNKTYQTLTLKLHTPEILHVMLNRPDKLNAMNPQFFLDLGQCFQNVNKDDNIRVVILTGNGKHFCSGLDLVQYGGSFELTSQQDPARNAIKIYQKLRHMQSKVFSVLQCRVPVLSGVHGACVGGGIDLLCMTDIRWCTSDAKFTIKQIDIGMAADLGTLQLFPHITGNHSFFREMAYTGRFFDSKQALQNGFVSKIFKDQNQLFENLLALANTIASKSPVGIWTIRQVAKRQLKKQLQQSFEYMGRTNVAMLQTGDMKEAITSFLMKKKAAFPKL